MREVCHAAAFPLPKNLGVEAQLAILRGKRAFVCPEKLPSKPQISDSKWLFSCGSVRLLAQKSLQNWSQSGSCTPVSFTSPAPLSLTGDDGDRTWNLCRPSRYFTTEPHSSLYERCQPKPPIPLLLKRKKGWGNCLTCIGVF